MVNFQFKVTFGDCVTALLAYTFRVETIIEWRVLKVGTPMLLTSFQVSRAQWPRYRVVYHNLFNADDSLMPASAP